MNKFTLILLPLIACLLLNPLTVAAEQLVIVVSVENQQSISLDDIADIYLGKQRSFANGDVAIPIHLSTSDPLYRAFAKNILKKSTSQLRAYWAKRIFTGKGKPPENIATRAKMATKIARKKQYIGYIDPASMEGNLRALVTINLDP